ncbi:MAG: peptidase, partial [Alistipes sp.]|nr:peptidase [Alistipes sp.]
YYIPSGRCIQAIDYSHSQEGAVSAVPDSLVSEFATRAGRKVYDGGGIMPDLPAEPEYISRFAATLYALGFIDDFGDEYMRRHPEAPADLTAFSISDADYDDFRKFMQDKQVPYESDSRRALRQLRDAAKADRFDAVGQQIAAIEESLHDDTQANIETYRKEIERSINSDIVLRHGYTQGVIARSLPDDKEVRQAVALLGDPQEYARILSEQDTRRK